MENKDFENNNHVDCPLLVLWGKKSHTEVSDGNVLETWRKYCTNKVIGSSINGGHYIQEENPKEILVKELFPLTEKKMIRYAQLQLYVSSKGDQWVSRIINNKLSFNLPNEEQYRGSNTFAFNSSKTKYGNT